MLSAETSGDNYDWGRAGEWDVSNDTTMLVARKDKKDITKHQTETLATYCRKEISWGGNVDGPGYKSERKERVEKYFRSSKFEEFLEEFKKSKLVEGNLSGADSVSPRSP